MIDDLFIPSIKFLTVLFLKFHNRLLIISKSFLALTEVPKQKPRNAGVPFPSLMLHAKLLNTSCEDSKLLVTI